MNRSDKALLKNEEDLLNLGFSQKFISERKNFLGKVVTISYAESDSYGELFYYIEEDNRFYRWYEKLFVGNKSYLDLSKKVKEYCKNYCIQECSKDCPLNIEKL